MRDLLTPADVANEISMLISSGQNVVLAVEGITDSRLYGKFTNNDNVRIVVAHSKSNVRRAVDECWNKRNLDTVVGIVDADLDRIRGRKRTPPVFNTDHRDLEIMMLASPAMDDILSEYADPVALNKFTEEYGPVFDAVISACYPIGLMMYVSEEYKLSLNFRSLKFDNFIDAKSLDVDLEELLAEIIYCTRGPCISKKELLKIVKNEISRDHNPLDYARGHDAVDVLLIALKSSFGSFNAKALRSGELSGAIRLAYSDTYFARTNLYGRTCEWSKEQGFRLWSLDCNL